MTGGRTALAATLLALACPSASAQTADPVRISFSRRGDDGLTLQFSAALEAALKSSKKITLVADNTFDMAFSIADHVVPEPAGRTTTGFRYTTILEWSPTARLATQGSCQLNDIPACASGIVANLENAVEPHR